MSNQGTVEFIVGFTICISSTTKLMLPEKIPIAAPETKARVQQSNSIAWANGKQE